ncbi:MAG TPA: NUDIX hydrolase [Micromonosporaceae bacterium]
MRTIRSAGGVLWRDGAAGVEVAIVHRDRYDDWSLPKGKVDKGEQLLATAVREVREETGVQALPQVRLPSTHYLTGEPDTEKTVAFWSMSALAVSDFVANDEVSELAWLPVDEAQERLTYAHDRGVLSAFAALRPVSAVAVLVRHAKAGSRKAWRGADDLRPLDDAGRQQAAQLGPLLSLFRPARVYAAPLTRCIDTVAPIGLPVRTDTVFAEATAAAPRAVAERLRSLVTSHGRVVVASQGGVIPDLLEALRPRNASATTSFATPKGSAWVLSFHGPDLVAADSLVLED